MQGVCLINYNARLYDPQIGRFMGADSMVEAPYSTQDWNRYTYVGNNPLSFSDPSGQCFLGCFWKSPIGKAAIEIVIIAVLQQDWALPAVLADVGVASASIPFVSTVAAAGIAGYVTSGRLNTALFDAFEAAAFFGTDLALKGTEIFGNHTAAEFLGHGLVGGIFSVGQKGGFPAGFMAAGFSSLADSVDLNNIYANAVVHALAGGTGSILGGGKFANGAVTGGLQYAAGRLGGSEDDSGEQLSEGGNGTTGDFFTDAPDILSKMRGETANGLAAAETKIWLASFQGHSTGWFWLDQLLGIGWHENGFFGGYNDATKQFKYQFFSGDGDHIQLPNVDLPFGFRVFIVEHTHPYEWSYLPGGFGRGPSGDDAELAHEHRSVPYFAIHESNPNGTNEFVYYH
jgi:RHS repeat-associated protein